MEQLSEIPPFPSAAKVRLAVTSSTSQGAREHQEDACGHWSDATGTCLFAVVADGAGGHGGGADAARAAITSAANTWRESPVCDLSDPAGFLAGWMIAAHRAVNEASARIQRSGRTVVIACLTDGSTAHWVHAGDCRLLRFCEGKLVERTRDDSVVQVLFERGEISEEEMGTHPDQSRLLQSLGGEDPPSPRRGQAVVAAGDVLILCSDGFWEHLKRGELEKLAKEPPARRRRALDQAVAEAVRRGGQQADNTTVVMIAVDGTTDGGSRLGIRWALWLFVIAIVLGSLAWWWGGRTRKPQTPSPQNPLGASHANEPSTPHE